MNEMRRNTRQVFWLLFLLFALLSAYLAKFLAVDAPGLSTSSLNPRLMLERPAVERGDILSADRALLAFSEGVERRYPLEEAASHITGYADSERAGFAAVEAKANFRLQKASWEMVQRVTGIFTQNKPKGDSVVLTVDSDLQKLAYSQLEGKKGAIVIMEPTTGKILAMASAPSFNPNTVSASWATLSKDWESSPLINRATQGLYPPGSVFKIATALSAMENMPDALSVTYKCAGTQEFSSKSLRCFNKSIHGTVNMETAFAVSCNIFFATMGLELGPTALQRTADKLLFNTQIPFELDVGSSAFQLDKNPKEQEIIDSSIGQGKTTATPLHMTLVASAVANGGIMMSPYIIDHYETFTGQTHNKRMPSMLAKPFTQEQANAISKMMKSAVDYGTANKAAVKGIDIAAKTGSAEASEGKTHGWLVAFGPYDNPEWALCAIVENAGGSSAILPMCKTLIERLAA
jgi:peptidoglycan glycosyltransferase